MYKILSNIVAFRMSHHIDANKLISNKQIIPNASNTYGTITQLFINKIVMDSVKLRQWNDQWHAIAHGIFEAQSSFRVE